MINDKTSQKKWRCETSILLWTCLSASYLTSSRSLEMLCNALMVFGNLGIKALVAVWRLSERLIFAEDDTQSVPSHGVRQTRHRGRNHPGPGGRPPAPPAGRPGGRDGRGAGRRGHRGGLPGQISHQTWGLQLWDLDNEKVPSFQYFDKGIFFNLRFLPNKI